MSGKKAKPKVDKADRRNMSFYFWPEFGTGWFGTASGARQKKNDLKRRDAPDKTTQVSRAPRKK